MSRKFVHIFAVGKKFGKWLVEDDSKSLWRVACECGSVKEVRRDFILRGLSKSCVSCAQVKHGMESSKAYNAWAAMKQRCTNEKNRFYHLYGGRGIAVCEKWMSFDGFLADMGVPKKGQSIGRIDNDGNYCKENCRWETPKQQIRNRSTTKLAVYKGKTYAIAELAERFGQSTRNVSDRLKAGWSIEDALTKRNRKAPPV